MDGGGDDDDMPALKLKSMNKCLSFVPRSTPPSLALSLSPSSCIIDFVRRHATQRRAVERNFQFRLDIGYAAAAAGERDGERERERGRKKVVAWF